jgi:hypothetical protein
MADGGAELVSGSKFSGYQVAMPEKLVPLAGSLGLSFW